MKAVLAPLGAMYLQLASRHHRRYDLRKRPVFHAPAPVLSIGNLTVGGSGKTPMTEWVARKVIENGSRVGIVSRGYGGRRDREPLIVSAVGHPAAPASAAGDEPAMLAKRLPAATIVVAAERFDAARLACELGAEALVLDDGFQHRRLHRDLNLLLLDARQPFGNGRGLPAGTLREPTSAVRRADAIVLTRADEIPASDGPLERESIPTELEDALSSLEHPPPVLAARHEPVAILREERSHDLDALSGKRVLAVSGIARPETFESTLVSLGIDLVDSMRFADHHPFSASDAASIAQRRDAAKADAVVTTEKDWMRWPDGAPAPHRLRIEMRLVTGEAWLEQAVRATLHATKWRRSRS